MIRLKKYFKVLNKSEQRNVFILFFALLCSSLIEVLGIAILPGYIAVLNDSESMMNHTYVKPFIEYLNFESENDLLLGCTFGLIILFVLKNTFIIIVSFFKTKFIYNLKKRISIKLFTVYMLSPFEMMKRRNSAELLRNLNGNVDTSIDNYLVPILRIAMDGLNILLIMILLMYVQPLVSISAILFLSVFSFAFQMSIKRKNKFYGKREQIKRLSLFKNIKEGIGGLKETHVLGRKEYFVNNFENSLNGAVEAARFKRFTGEIGRPIMETFSMVGILIIAMAFLVNHSDLSNMIPTLALFAIAAVKLIPAVNGTLTSINVIKYYEYAVSLIYDDLTQENFIKKDDLSKTNAKIFNKEIVLKNISYSYPDANERAIRNISMTINKGSSIALIGLSGGGKTTIADLILGLITPTNGNVYIDGDVLSRDNLKSWRSNIGYIPQQIFLADSTIKSNIAFGIKNNDIEDDKLRLAIEASQLGDFVNSLPQKENTLIGENGTRLSGGQRQRIGIARALYHQPQVLIMDEATAALDNKTERDFVAALNSLRSNYTMIIIAHRLTTVRNVDCLYIIKDGRIIDSGSNKELLENSKEYQLMQ